MLAWCSLLAGCAAAGAARCATPPGDVLRARGLGALSWRSSDRAVERQANIDGDVCLSRALDAALVGFLGDGADAESPLAIAASAAPGAPCPQSDVGARLRCYLRRPGAEIGLASAASGGAEAPEAIERAWMFYLSIPELSDHIFWAAVARQRRGGRVDVRIYGVN